MIYSYHLLTVCDKCPVGTEPVEAFEYKWWNTMPSNMKSSTFSQDFSDFGRSTGEIRGDSVTSGHLTIISTYINSISNHEFEGLCMKLKLKVINSATEAVTGLR